MLSNNLDPNARLCMASVVMGFVTQFQSDEPMGCYDDLQHATPFSTSTSYINAEKRAPLRIRRGRWHFGRRFSCDEFSASRLNMQLDS